MDNDGLCLSALPILRCASFSRLENQILIIPTALEVIFSTTLVFTNWKSGRRFLLITAEGWIYLALAILELLSHLMSDVRTNITVFRAIDITIAVVALLPVLLYTLFIYLFMRAELVDILPHRFQVICRYTLVFFIPAIVVLNEVASLLGIAYRMIPISPAQSVIGIGFNTRQDQYIWSFLTSLTLALHTSFQALNFSLAFFRIAKAFFMQRQIETSSSDEAYLFKGIGWIAGGLKLGAIETVIGFAQSGFGGALTRRILRFLSRACLCIGIVKGVDMHENFSRVQDEMSSKPQTRGRLLISSPRMSTFLQMSPSATAFHAAPRAPPVASSDKSRAPNGLPGMIQFAGMKDDESGQGRQRVTVHFQGGAPTLHMRFSALDLPSPAVIVESIKAEPIETHAETQAKSHQRASSYYPSSVYSAADTARTPIFARHTRAFSEYSTHDSLNTLFALRELAAQFPGLPPRVTDKTQAQIPWKDPYPSNSQHQSSLSRGDSSATRSSRSASMSRLGRNLSTSSSIRRKPVPRLSDNIDPFSDDGDESGVGGDGVPLQATNLASTKQHAYHNSGTESFGSTPMTNYSASAGGGRGNDTDAATTPGSEDPFMYDENPSANLEPLQSKLGVQAELHAVHEYVVDVDEQAEVHEESNTLTRIRKAVPAARIKSVGNAPRRSTPQPIKNSMRHTRGSIYIEPILIPPKPDGMPEVVQDMGQSVTSNFSSALRDSDVFGGSQDMQSEYRS